MCKWHYQWGVRIEQWWKATQTTKGKWWEATQTTLRRSTWMVGVGIRTSWFPSLALDSSQAPWRRSWRRRRRCWSQSLLATLCCILITMTYCRTSSGRWGQIIIWRMSSFPTNIFGWSDTSTWKKSWRKYWIYLKGGELGKLWSLPWGGHLIWEPGIWGGFLSKHLTCPKSSIWRKERLTLGMSPADPWKWKWLGKCRKSEISLIWCISTTNNVKSCKKFNETAQTANFTDFLLTFCENRPKWTKTMQTQTRRVRLQKFLRGIQICHMKADVLPFLKMWWFLKLELLLLKVGSNIAILIGKVASLKKILRFDPTWGSYNSGLKNYRISNNHIFGIARTSAFIWHIWIPLKKFCKRTRRVCVCIVLVHFGRYSQEDNGKSVKLAVWAVSLNFLHNFTLFVVD